MSSEARNLRDTNEPGSEAWLRQRFADGRAVTPIATGDGHLWRQTEELRPAAVLVPVVRRDAGLTILFTRRTDHLYDHAGQISFPGGRTEARDESPAATALRETFEEIGLPQSRVEVLGSLPEPACLPRPGHKSHSSHSSLYAALKSGYLHGWQR